MRTLCLLLLSITTSRSFMPKTLPRRSAIAALTSVPFLAAPPATAFPKDPLTRLVESTKAKRLRDGAREHFEEEEEGVIEDVLADGATGGAAGGTPAAATLTTPAGLAKVDAELNAMFESGDEANFAQLRSAIRAPVFYSFLGFAPADNDVDRQVDLIMTFPVKARREAAKTLKVLNAKLTAFDESLARMVARDEALAAASAPAGRRRGAVAPASAAAPVAEPSAAVTVPLTAAIADIRDTSQQLTKLYMSEGCMVCPDPIQSSSQNEFENPNYRKLKEFEPRLLRRPDERNEVVARQLGFREGELIGGYDQKD